MNFKPRVHTLSPDKFFWLLLFAIKQNTNFYKRLHDELQSQGAHIIARHVFLALTFCNQIHTLENRQLADSTNWFIPSAS